jgi:uncharacterized protein YerC
MIAEGQVGEPLAYVLSSENSDLECVVMPVRLLLPSDSPRLAGEDMGHARLLAESEADLPPILVHRKTKKVIDGMHRLRAAMLRGEQTIAVLLFDGTEEAAFVLAVRMNITHGLPLSLADREAAASRILGATPNWSDRVISDITGLSSKTIGAIRRREGVGNDADYRVGRDGRYRPLNCDDGRNRAAELFEANPGASLRTVAREAGVSLGTARDVRRRLNRGEDPVPSRRRNDQNPSEAHSLEQRRRFRSAVGIDETRSREAVIANLRLDPSVRYTEPGRRLLRWLDGYVNGLEDLQKYAAMLPPHCGYAIAELAYAIADEWLEVAAQVHCRTEGTG